jgi:two-component system OmpR family sensor kinase
MDPHSSKSSELDLHRLIAELQAQLQERDEFIAVAAHELRNPLMPISMDVELLSARAERLAEQLPPEFAQGLQRLQRNVAAFIRRAGVLLDVSRAAAGNIELERVPVDLTQQVHQVMNTLAQLACRAGCALTCDRHEPLMGHGDATALEQIIENLLSNAIRYGAGAAIEVRITHDVDHARVSVRDRGVGIPETDQQRIFERFQRAGTRRRDGGFGVGLWIARQLARRMSGDIVVQSEAGAGATFTLTLPLTDKV